MREGQSTVTRRQDYAPPAFWIDTVELSLDLDPAKTRVLNKMRLRRVRDKTPYSQGDRMMLNANSGWMISGSPDKLVRNYNELINTSNRLN